MSLFEHMNSFNHKQSCPVTMNNSNEVSFEQPSRKHSVASLRNQIDIDKVMIDIKLTPLKSSQFDEKIRTIYSCLDYLKNISPYLLEQVRTAQLVIQSIQKKFALQSNQTKRNSVPKKSHAREDSQINSMKKSQHQRAMSLNKNGIQNSIQKNQVSPIKLWDQNTSRIVYANFSIKDLQGSSKKLSSNIKNSVEKQCLKNKINETEKNLRQSSSMKSIRKQSDSKAKLQKKQTNIFTVSKFDPEDEEIEQLTQNISNLDKLLQKKGIGLRNVTLNQNRNSLALKPHIFNTDKKQIPLKPEKKSVFQRDRSSANKQNRY